MRACKSLQCIREDWPEDVLCLMCCAHAVGTPFESGVFKMKLVLGSDFPNVPPKGEQCSLLPLLMLLHPTSLMALCTP